MTDQEILDNAPKWVDTYRKLLDYPDCTTYANNAKDEQLLDRSLVDIKRIAELEKENASLDAQNKRVCSEIAELEKELKETREICDAVAHVGVDFGYGVYVLEDSVIHRARLILEALKEQVK